MSWHAMLCMAIKALAERGGSSRQALRRYIGTNFPERLQSANSAALLRSALKRGIKQGDFIQRLQSFSLSPAARAVKAVKKKRSPRQAVTTAARPKKNKSLAKTKTRSGEKKKATTTTTRKTDKAKAGANTTAGKTKKKGAVGAIGKAKTKSKAKAKSKTKNTGQAKTAKGKKKAASKTGGSKSARRPRRPIKEWILQTLGQTTSPTSFDELMHALCQKHGIEDARRAAFSRSVKLCLAKESNASLFCLYDDGSVVLVTTQTDVAAKPAGHKQEGASGKSSS
jgi:histone H1/5